MHCKLCKVCCDKQPDCSPPTAFAGFALGKPAQAPLDFGGGGGGGSYGGSGGPCGAGGGSFCHQDGCDVSVKPNDDANGYIVIRAVNWGTCSIHVDPQSGLIRCDSLQSASSFAEQTQLQGCFVVGFGDSNNVYKMVQEHGISTILQEVQHAPEGKKLLVGRRSAEATTSESLVQFDRACAVSRVDSSLLQPARGKEAARSIGIGGRTALHWALEMDAPEAIVDQLLHLAPTSVNVRDCNGTFSLSNIYVILLCRVRV